MIRLLLKTVTDKKDITPITMNFTLKYNVDALACELNFDFVKNIQFSNFTNAREGDILELYTTSFLTPYFTGKIEKVTINQGTISCIAYDKAYMLNKGKEIFQFNCYASEAIKIVCNTRDIDIGTIPVLNTVIKKIYNTKTYAEVINDILDEVYKQTGNKYKIEVENDALNIVNLNKQLGILKVAMASNVGPENINLYIINPSHSYSIEDMYNSVKVVHKYTENNTEFNTISAEIKDDTNINKYGLRQEVIEIDKDDLSYANNIANNFLTENNKVKEEISLTMFGHWDVKAGRLITINDNAKESEILINGNYLVKDVVHTFKNDIHTMQLSLVVV